MHDAPIRRAAVLEILRTPAASDTFTDMIARVEALEPVAQPETPTPGQLDPEQLARRFHDIYEQLAPNFGYETRPETRNFDPESPNGKLMIAVCGALQPTPGQFTTMCLAIEDVITGRGFDVDPWQPIETAQRPPVQSPIVEAILAYWPGGFIESVYWADGWWPTAYDAERPWNDPTLWMPLPYPPGETTSAIPEEVKAYLRNALMVGGWRGES